IYDGWCEAGCPTGALVNPQVTYLPVARKAGVEIRADAYVTRVLVDAKGDRAAGVEYYDKQKQRQEQRSEEHTSELQSRSDLVCRPIRTLSLHDALPISSTTVGARRAARPARSSIRR